MMDRDRDRSEYEELTDKLFRRYECRLLALISQANEEARDENIRPDAHISALSEALTAMMVAVVMAGSDALGLDKRQGLATMIEAVTSHATDLVDGDDPAEPEEAAVGV